MANVKLRPCPFCGGEPRLEVTTHDSGLKSAHVYCLDCFSRSSQIYSGLRPNYVDLAVACWQKRSSPEV